MTEDVDFFIDAFSTVTVLGDTVVYAVSGSGSSVKLKKGVVERIIRTKHTHPSRPPRYYHEVHVRFREAEKGRPGLGKLQHTDRIARMEA